MPTLRPLRDDDGAAVLAFELANRGFFARTISDRGDDYFERFAERHAAMLAEQDDGTGAFYLLLDDDGTVLGRFNLWLGPDGVATLGYRVAERATGRGVATATVLDVLRLAAGQYAVTTVRAATSHTNVASRRVLEKAGFVADGPAGPDDLGGRHGTWYRYRHHLRHDAGMSAESTALWPSLTVHDVAAMTDFLRAVGFVEHATYRDDVDPAVVHHAEWLWPPGGGIMFGSERPGGALHNAGRSALYLVCDDPDAVFGRAVAAGASVVRDMVEQDYGGRGGSVEDPDGNHWSFGSYQPR